MLLALMHDQPVPSPVDHRPSLPFDHPLMISDCTHPTYDNCSFYANCLESRYNCGPTGYPIGYGQHFCQTFSEKRSSLSEEGQTWMLKTMHCLQTALVSDATGADDTTCGDLKRKAMGTHAACYVDNGWCELPSADWWVVLDIVRLRTLFQNWDAVKASVQAALECALIRGHLYLGPWGIFTRIESSFSDHLLP